MQQHTSAWLYSDFTHTKLNSYFSTINRMTTLQWARSCLLYRTTANKCSKIKCIIRLLQTYLNEQNKIFNTTIKMTQQLHLTQYNIMQHAYKIKIRHYPFLNCHTKQQHIASLYTTSIQLFTIQNYKKSN